MKAVAATNPRADERADRIRVYRPVIKFLTLLAFGIPPVAYFLLQFGNDDDLMVLVPVCAPLFLFTLALLAILTFRSGPDNVKALDRLYAFMFFMLFMFTTVLISLWYVALLDWSYVGSAYAQAHVRVIVPTVLCLLVGLAFAMRLPGLRLVVAAFILWTCLVTHVWVMAPHRMLPLSRTSRARENLAPTLFFQETEFIMRGVTRRASPRISAMMESQPFRMMTYSSPFWRPGTRDLPHFAFCALLAAYTFFIRRRLLAKTERAG
jgi:hypothetical protein